MKIKDFKKQVQSEQYDIPNVLDNIKNIAYNMDYKISPQKKYNLKWLYSLVPAICLLLVFSILIMNNENFRSEDPGIDKPSEIDPSEKPSEDDLENNVPDNGWQSPEEDTNQDIPEQIPGDVVIGKPDEPECSECKEQEKIIYEDYYSQLPNYSTEGSASNNTLVTITVTGYGNFSLLNKDQFFSLKLFLDENPDATRQETYVALNKKFNLSKENSYALFNAYDFIINKVNEKGN